MTSVPPDVLTPFPPFRNDRGVEVVSPVNADASRVFGSEPPVRLASSIPESVSVVLDELP